MYVDLFLFVFFRTKSVCFQGIWEPRKIPNPDYFEDNHPYKLTPIGSLALELWSMVDGVVFDNFVITSDQSIAKQYADQIWYPKSVLETKAISSASESVIDAIVNATKGRPWLWAVYLVAILLPLVILFVFCWSKKSTKVSQQDALRKKTDVSEPNVDSEQQVLTRNNDEDEDDDGEVEEIDTNEQPTKRSNANATGRDALENDAEVSDAAEEETTEESNTAAAAAPSSPSAGNKARRRPRKD